MGIPHMAPVFVGTMTWLGAQYLFLFSLQSFSKPGEKDLFHQYSGHSL